MNSKIIKDIEMFESFDKEYQKIINRTPDPEGIDAMFDGATIKKEGKKHLINLFKQGTLDFKDFLIIIEKDLGFLENTYYNIWKSVKKLINDYRIKISKDKIWKLN